MFLDVHLTQTLHVINSDSKVKTVTQFDPSCPIGNCGNVIMIVSWGSLKAYLYCLRQTEGILRAHLMTTLLCADQHHQGHLRFLFFSKHKGAADRCWFRWCSHWTNSKLLARPLSDHPSHLHTFQQCLKPNHHIPTCSHNTWWHFSLTFCVNDWIRPRATEETLSEYLISFFVCWDTKRYTFLGKHNSGHVRKSRSQNDNDESCRTSSLAFQRLTKLGFFRNLNPLGSSIHLTFWLCFWTDYSAY